jgi:osmotically-inducible protein OsmY
MLTGALAGCATYGKCGFEGCPGDAKVTANVQTLFEEHPELGLPNSIHVWTADHVVYLNGIVGGDFTRQQAKVVALEAPGVKQVVNWIAVSK